LSPDGRYIAFSGVRGEFGFTQLVVITADGTSETPYGGGQGEADYEPDWQQAMVSYPRPKSASPLRVPLVPSYALCTAPNRTHGPPLAFGSCNPPSQTSPHITVGTPDANGAAANSVGHLLLRVFPGNFPPDEADVLIDLELSDVRCVSTGGTCGPANDRAGPDYTGELRLELVVQLTDKSVPGDPKTTQEFTLPIQVPCSATSSAATGAVCSVYTYANVVLPGSAREGKRAIWQLRKVRVFDGGADGDADTAGDNHPFGSQGIFVP